jgi:hypothetical protein
MPTCDPSCPDLYGSNINAYTSSFKSAGNPNEVFASMGWVGYVVLNIQQLNRKQVLRVTNSTLNLRQEVTLPDVIDGRIDKTVYQLGPKIVEGDLTMPLVADVDPASVTSLSGCVNASDIISATSAGLMDTLWCWAGSRSAAGRMMYDQASLDVRYANHASFRYDRAMANRLSLEVTESQPVNVTVGIIGRSRNRYETPEVDPPLSDMLAPARVLTWNDFSVDGFRGCTGADTALFYSNQVRQFSFDITNNVERYYTLNGDLMPADINARKREITGTMRLMGMNHELSRLAEGNQDRFTEKNWINMALYIGNSTYDYNSATFKPRSGTPVWLKKITSVVFKVEELSMTNELFETTVNWQALANDQSNYEAFDPATSCSFPPW